MSLKGRVSKVEQAIKGQALIREMAFRKLSRAVADGLISLEQVRERWPMLASLIQEESHGRAA